MRRAARALVISLAVAAALPVAAQQDGPAVAVLPLKSKGLQTEQQRKILQKALVGWRNARPDVVEPTLLLQRLARDERYRIAIDSAQKLTKDGVEKYRGLDRNGARAAFEQALKLYRDNYGEYVDPEGMAETLLWRGAERLASSDPSTARQQFLKAVTIAPDHEPSLDEFPPPVLEGWESARSARRILPPDDEDEIKRLASALGVATITTVRAERNEEGIAVELVAWSLPFTGQPRASRVVLPAILDDTALERVSAATTSIASPRTLGTPVAVRTETFRPPDPVRTPIVRRPKPRRDAAWKNPWLWTGIGAVVAAGAGAGYLEYQRQQDPEPEPFKVILVPPP